MIYIIYIYIIYNSRFFSPHTQYGSCLAFLSREDFSSYFLPSSTRVEFPRCQALSAFCEKFKISPTAGFERTEQHLVVTFEDYHQTRLVQSVVVVVVVLVFTLLLNLSFYPTSISSTPGILPDSSSQRDVYFVVTVRQKNQGRHINCQRTTVVYESTPQNATRETRAAK